MSNTNFTAAATYFTLTALLLGGLFTAKTINDNNTNTDLRENGTTAEIMVTEKDSRLRMVGKIFIRKYYLTYISPAGNTEEMKVDRDLYNQTETEDTLTVCYTFDNIEVNFPDCAN